MSTERGVPHVISECDNMDGIIDIPPSSTTAAAFVEPDTEMDDAEVPRQFVASRNFAQGDASGSHSSLSDASAGLLPEDIDTTTTTVEESARPDDLMHIIRRGNEGEETMVPMNGPRTLRPAFARMDSSSSAGSYQTGRASSQNSSNDWGYGWYEDVHGSSHHSTAPLTPGGRRSSSRSSKNKKQGGLVPQVSQREVQDVALHTDKDPGEFI